MSKLSRHFAILASVLIFGGLAFGHHGGAAYDTQNPVTLHGIVKEVYWANPHVQLILEVKDAKGAATQWTIETQSPGKLNRVGWTRDLVTPGMQVTVMASPAKKGEPVGLLRELTLPNGKVLGGTKDDTYQGP